MPEPIQHESTRHVATRPEPIRYKSTRPETTMCETTRLEPIRQDCLSNMKSFQIRPAEPEDCPEILRLIKVNFFFLILWRLMALV